MHLFSCTCRSFDAESSEETTRHLVVEARDFLHAEFLANTHLLRLYDGRRVVHSVDVHLAERVHAFWCEDADEAKNQADAAYNRGE